MIKLVLTGVWVCAITLASVYFTVHSATAPAPAPDDSKQSQLELVKGETITVPVVKDGAVAGYFLGKMSFMMNKEMIKNVSLPLTEMTTDELFTLLVGNKMIDVTNMKAFDPQAFRDLIKKNINSHLGGEYIDQVMLEQMDYISKEEVGATSSGHKTKTGKPVNVIPPAEANAAATA
jgi:predicted DNA binding CopG/RHH family protein